MTKCGACGNPAEMDTTVACCRAHKGLVTGLLAVMRPGELGPEVELSPERRLCLAKMQEMARELAEATFTFSSPDLRDEQFGRVFATVEEMWSALKRGEGGSRKRLPDLLH